MLMEINISMRLWLPIAKSEISDSGQGAPGSDFIRFSCRGFGAAMPLYQKEHDRETADYSFVHAAWVALRGRSSGGSGEGDEGGSRKARLLNRAIWASSASPTVS